MRTYLKSIFKKLLIVIISYLLILPIFIIKTDYEITTPGMLNKVQEQVLINNSNINNNFYTTSVFYKNSNVTPFEVLIASLSKKNEIEKISYSYSHLNNVDYYYQGKISKLTSINNSLIASYSEANKINNEINIDFTFNGFYVYYKEKDLSSDILRISDIIIGSKKEEETEYKTIKEEIYTDLTNNLVLDLKILRLKDNLYSKNISDSDFLSLDNYDTVFIKLDRKDKSQEKGISLMNYYGINNSNPKYQLYEQTSSGNSGGLMQTLSLYYSLINQKFDINIAGTGTIDVIINYDYNLKKYVYENSKVGAIGGIVQKIYTADYKRNLKVFFCPIGEKNTSEYNNYVLALDTYNKLKNPKFDLVFVDSFDKAILYLEEI